MKFSLLSAFALMITIFQAQAQAQTHLVPVPATKPTPGTPAPNAAPATLTPPTAPPPPPEPGITQIRKSVAFIKLECSQNGQSYQVRGTGFFVAYPDPRLSDGASFVYLVTNRHVALCLNDEGHPMQVQSISVILNRRQVEGGTFEQSAFLNERGNAAWVVPHDDSVDLAALPVGPDPAHYDYKTLPVAILASSDFLKQHRVTEGEPVFFAGFFSQFPGAKRMEPIVRQGIIAMMPDELFTVAGVTQKVYLADLHAFHGNSGSPVFINLGGYHNGSFLGGDDYHLLGVINAEVTEDENFNLELASTFKGKGLANSGVSTLVPADKIMELLDDPRLRSLRDGEVQKSQATAGHVPISSAPTRR